MKKTKNIFILPLLHKWGKLKTFQSSHFSTLLTKHKRGKLKTFFSSHFFILSLYFLFSYFFILPTKRTNQIKNRRKKNCMDHKLIKTTCNMSLSASRSLKIWVLIITKKSFKICTFHLSRFKEMSLWKIALESNNQFNLVKQIYKKKKCQFVA